MVLRSVESINYISLLLFGKDMLQIVVPNYKNKSRQNEFPNGRIIKEFLLFFSHYNQRLANKICQHKHVRKLAFKHLIHDN